MIKAPNLKNGSSYATFQQNVINFLHLPLSYIVECNEAGKEKPTYSLDLAPFNGGSLSFEPNQKWLSETAEMLDKSGRLGCRFHEDGDPSTDSYRCFNFYYLEESQEYSQ